MSDDPPKQGDTKRRIRKRNRAVKPIKPPKPEGIDHNIRFKGKGASMTEGEPKKIRLTKQPLKGDEWGDFFNEMMKATDRASAIIIAAHLEAILMQRISLNFKNREEGFLDKLTGERGPLSSFSSKIDIGFALGLYDEHLHGDIHTIRKIRNNFAHALRPIKFTEPEIADLCYSISFFEKGAKFADKKLMKFSEPRRIYILASNVLQSMMIEQMDGLRPTPLTAADF